MDPAVMAALILLHTDPDLGYLIDVFWMLKPPSAVLKRRPAPWLQWSTSWAGAITFHGHNWWQHLLFFTEEQRKCP